MIHLQGMGLLGSLTAWQLLKHRIPFEWSDNDQPTTAWRACTGACYPASGDVDSRCYRRWRLWASGRIYPSDCLQSCAYWVDGTHKTLPHGLSAEVQAELGGMRLVGKSVHLNAQRLVAITRERFASIRSVCPTKAASRLIVSHGFSKRRARFLWGWTRLIRLTIPNEIAVHGRPSFYLRKNRFQFAYCYPQPGSDWWYAGSSLISQAEARSLHISDKYAAWKDRFSLLSGGLVGIKEEGQMIEGWRPAKAGSLSKLEGHKAESEPLLMRDGSTIYYPALASNGFRHFPAVWDELAQELGVAQ